jgi:hypothetical protein
VSERRRLRYSERKSLRNAGSLPDLDLENVPVTLRGALEYYINNEPDEKVGFQFRPDLQRLVARHFGAPEWTRVVREGDVDPFLDFCEILADAALTRHEWINLYGQGGHFPALPRVLDDLNELFDRHRFGYRFEGDEILPISSPLVDEVVVSPALLAVARPGWEEVERSYREAVQHLRRSDEGRDALTSASSAVESALKAIGLNGNSLTALVRSLGRSGRLPGHTAAIFPQLDTLFGRLNAWRSTEGDAHGRPPNTGDPPRPLVALAVHWAGAALVYLASLEAGDD